MRAQPNPITIVVAYAQLPIGILLYQPLTSCAACNRERGRENRKRLKEGTGEGGDPRGSLHRSSHLCSQNDRLPAAGSLGPWVPGFLGPSSSPAVSSLCHQPDPLPLLYWTFM